MIFVYALVNEVHLAATTAPTLHASKQRPDRSVFFLARVLPSESGAMRSRAKNTRCALRCELS